MSEGFTRRRQSRWGEGAALKEEIVRAAARMLSESGRERDLSLRAVAREVGISAPSIYLHFTDRAELVATVTRRAYERLADELRSTWTDAREAGPQAALRVMARHYCTYALDHPRVYRLMFGIERIEVPRSQAASHPLWTVHEVWTEAVAACRGGDEGPVASGRSTPLLWASVHGLVAMAMAVPFAADRAQLEGMVDELLDLLVAG
ncbi:TetR/AcrR family transcriptional regulator [Streptomyces sp. NPDC088785]|uniref:TetR/AcrR family transcriptional regulator n=1 Tax=Streptomyces sp. NPDC088785 TaxID=3365897 RepID=UPI0038271082